MTPRADKSRCTACGERPKPHDGGLDSNFMACDCCTGEYYDHVYYGGDLPKPWRLDRWYAARFYFVKWLRVILCV